jgi:hypothetical protein
VFYFVTISIMCLWSHAVTFFYLNY